MSDILLALPVWLAVLLLVWPTVLRNAPRCRRLTVAALFLFSLAVSFLVAAAYCCILFLCIKDNTLRFVVMSVSGIGGIVFSIDLALHNAFEMVRFFKSRKE